MLKDAVERETGILTEVDSYDRIAFLPMAMALELTTVQPLLREAGHGQDEDPGSFGPQKRHAPGTCSGCRKNYSRFWVMRRAERS